MEERKQEESKEECPICMRVPLRLFTSSCCRQSICRKCLCKIRRACPFCNHVESEEEDAAPQPSPPSAQIPQTDLRDYVLATVMGEYLQRIAAQQTRQYILIHTGDPPYGNLQQNEPS